MPSKAEAHESSQMSQLGDGELSLRTKGTKTHLSVLPYPKRKEGTGWYMVLAALLLVTQVFDQVTKELDGKEN